MNPVILPLAMAVVMLWMIWTDSVRRRPLPRWFYLIRGLLFGGVTALLLYHAFTRPGAYPGGTIYLLYFAAFIGVAGLIYFFRKVFARTARTEFKP